MAPATRLSFKRPAYRYAATVLAVHDGDTYTLDVDLGFDVHTHINLRLLGWNCPELSETDGPPAREAANLLLSDAGQVIVETMKDEQTFARWLGKVYVDGKDLGELLQAQGFATARH